jgi:hypothetical protein
MAWEKLTNIPASRTVGVRVSIRSAGYASPRLFVRIFPHTAKAAGLPDGVSRTSAFIGAGADAGLMRIRHERDGEFPCYAPADHETMYKVIVNPLPAGAPQSLRSTPCEVLPGRGAITFRMPWYVQPTLREVEVKEDQQESVVSDRLVFPAEVMPALQLPIIRETSPETLDELAREFPMHEVVQPESVRPIVPDQAAIRQALDQIESEIDKPLNGSARNHVYADSETAQRKYTFVHKSKTCMLTKREYDVVTKLHHAMIKVPGGFIDHNILVQAAKVKDKDALGAVISVIRKLILPLGLHIKPQPKMGYWMEDPGR